MMAPVSRKPCDFVTLSLLIMAVAAAFVWLQSKESSANSYARLQFRRDEYSSSFSSTTSTFKILQLADIHLGEAENTDWGPQQDVKTYVVLDTIIPLEQPDLIVLSGDQLTANDMDQNATAYYYQLCQALTKYGIPWAMIHGNHDDMGYEYRDSNGNMVYTNQTKTSRQELFEVDHSFAPLSLTQQGPSTLFGTSNYILNVHLESTIALQLLFLDSGGGTLPQKLESNQIQWFREKRSSTKSTKNNGGADIPLVAFQHIPTTEFTYIDNDDNNDNGGTCQGQYDDAVDAIQSDPGIVNVLHQDGNAHFLAVGHNHGNDYCCPYQQKQQQQSDSSGSSTYSSHMHVCFGRHTGYGGYGSWDRGARVYEMQLLPSDDKSSLSSFSSKTKMIWKTWVRMESGEIQNEYNPFDNANNEDDDNNDDQD